MDELRTSGRAQLTYVKTRAEAEALAADWKVKCHHSKMSEDERANALQALASGTPLVCTYGLAVGMNLKVQEEPVTSVDIVGELT